MRYLFLLVVLSIGCSGVSPVAPSSDVSPGGVFVVSQSHHHPPASHPDPVALNRPPVGTLDCDRVRVDEWGTVRLTASDPDGDPLEVIWRHPTKGRTTILERGPYLREFISWDEGRYRFNVWVKDDQGGVLDLKCYVRVQGGEVDG